MRNNPLLSFIFILLFSILILTLYSYSSFNFSIFNIEIKKIGHIFPDNYNSQITSDTVSTDSLKSGKKEVVRQLDTNSQNILLIGDSMVEGLMHKFNDYCLENGHKLQPLIWYSSSTKAYSDNNKLKEFIKKYNATYVILVLGANELFVKDLDNRDKYIKNISRQIDTMKFIWVGPPNWKKDTGLNDLILKNFGKDRYFPSKDLTFDRISDGAHPTKKSSEMWALKIIEWIKNDSRYPIKLNEPTVEYNEKIKAVLMNYAKNN